jgi:hypothetical protein
LQRSRLRGGINFSGDRLKFKKDLINPLIGDVIDVYDVISDGLVVQRNANHNFFNLLVGKIIGCMRLEEMLDLNREMVLDFFSLLTSISSQITADNAVSVGEKGNNVAASMSKLTKIMTAVAILQLIVAIVTLMKVC